MKPTAIPHAHTPGPWHFEPADRGDDSVGIPPSPPYICADVEPHGSGDVIPICTLDEPERRAMREPVDEYDECREAFGTVYGNAVLIAAAPDLLAALRYLVSVPSRLSGEQIARAKLAIAKAEGTA
jgi:hypothetical protein